MSAMTEMRRHAVFCVGITSQHAEMQRQAMTGRHSMSVSVCVCVCVSQTEMTGGVVSYIKPCRQTDGMNGRAAMDEQ